MDVRFAELPGRGEVGPRLVEQPLDERHDGVRTIRLRRAFLSQHMSGLVVGSYVARSAGAVHSGRQGGRIHMTSHSGSMTVATVR